jgi:TonB family protein
MNCRRLTFSVLLLSLTWGGAAGAQSGEVGKEFTVQESRLTALETNQAHASPDELLELALAYDERKQTAKAVEYYERAAARGIGVAELRLGWLHEIGAGVPQSYAQARQHYEKAVSLGVTEANLRLGLHYLEGWGVPRDVPTAVARMQVAADAGYQPAQRILSEMYFSGTGVAADLKQALVWAEKSAAQNDPNAQTMVGAIRQRAARLPGDIQAAREWYQLSAEQDYTAGMRSMATTFLKPAAKAEEVAIGLRWLELAIEGGDRTAGFYLAGMYLWHPRLRQDPAHVEKAEQLLKQAAKRGDLASAEVLESAGEQSLADAFRYVTSVPVEVRFIRRSIASAPTAKEIANGLVRPRPIKLVQPVYPAAMKLAAIEGTVEVQFVIDTTGRVRDVSVVSTTHPAFADHAIACISNWRFAPGTKDGRVVNVRALQKLEFSMAGQVDAVDVAKFRPKAATQ